jgi:hypothetical protein
VGRGAERTVTDVELTRASQRLPQRSDERMPRRVDPPLLGGEGDRWHRRKFGHCRTARDRLEAPQHHDREAQLTVELDDHRGQERRQIARDLPLAGGGSALDANRSDHDITVIDAEHADRRGTRHAVPPQKSIGNPQDRAGSGLHLWCAVLPFPPLLRTPHGFGDDLTQRSARLLVFFGKLFAHSFLQGQGVEWIFDCLELKDSHALRQKNITWRPNPVYKRSFPGSLFIYFVFFTNRLFEIYREAVCEIKKVHCNVSKFTA